MRHKDRIVSRADAPPGRATPIVVAREHLTLHVSMLPPYPAGTETAYFALGCFWGAERRFFEREGVRVTAAGYQGGVTANPTYEEVCSGRTGHAETVLVVFDPTVVTYRDLVQRFFESHDPTQGNRQGNDVGTQYRSVIFVTSEAQRLIADEVKRAYGDELSRRGFGPITTTIEDATPFYLAEEYHQQYLVANPNGYCGLGGTGVSCPVGLS